MEADEILDYLASNMDLMQQYFNLKQKNKRDLHIFKLHRDHTNTLIKDNNYYWRSSSAGTFGESHSQIEAPNNRNFESNLKNRIIF